MDLHLHMHARRCQLLGHHLDPPVREVRSERSAAGVWAEEVVHGLKEDVKAIVRGSFRFSGAG